MDHALRWLTFRARSQREMADRLGQNGFDPAVIEETLGRLTELGLLNDGALARDMAESRRRGGRGDHRIRQELRKRGLPPQSISEAIATPPPAESSERAWAALQKRAGRMKGVERDRAYRRLNGYLMRQGFGVDETRQALKRYFSGEPERREIENDEDL
jgi:regulatory protein